MLISHDSLPRLDVPVRWRLGTRLAFRWCVIYFTLYVGVNMLFGFFPSQGDLLALGTRPPLRNLAEWIAAHVFGHTGALTMGGGSGDKIFDWAQALSLVVIATIGTAVWSWLDRAREHYDGLNAWFRLLLRLALGATLAMYGAGKAIPLQMPAPSLARLLEPYGHFSPMGVLWASVGASRSYEICTGAAEVIAAVLLLLPGLTTIGALASLLVMTQVFILNMTYDVPVKLFSFHLCLISLVLLAPDIKRLVRVLILNRAVDAPTRTPLVRRPGVMRMLIVAQVVFAVYIVSSHFYVAAQRWNRFGGGAPTSPLYGIWIVDEMTIDGQTRSPLVTDYGRWRRVIFQTPIIVSFQRMDDTFARYGTAIDVPAKTITLSKTDDKKWSARFAYQRPSPDRLSMDGTMDGHAIHMGLRLFDHKTLLLVSRGFHWVQELPFNR